MSGNPAADIVNKIQDYREGEISPRSEADVIKWVRQFNAPIRDEMLASISALLEHSYIPKSIVVTFLQSLATNDKVTGGDHKAYWEACHPLEIQKGGQSQRDMMAIFRQIVTVKAKATLGSKRATSNTFVYIDDVICTGSRVHHDLVDWIKSSAPAKCEINIIVLAVYEGSYYWLNKIDDAIKESGKSIEIHKWRARTLENRRAHINNSDVLRPRKTPANPDVEQYVQSLGHAQVNRTADSTGKSGLFVSEQQRNFLEQELLIAGVGIRKKCRNLPEVHRPLGFDTLKTFGFGSTLVTFRNCPNNSPLALWVGDPWIPLLPRKNN